MLNIIPGHLFKHIRHNIIVYRGHPKIETLHLHENWIFIDLFYSRGAYNGYLIMYLIFS